MTWSNEYASAIFTVCFLGVGLRLIYNVYFHPLRSYPGPLLAKVTPLRQAFYFLRGREAFECLKLHETYGDVVRIAPNTLSFIQEDSWRTIYRESRPLALLSH